MLVLKKKFCWAKLILIWGHLWHHTVFFALFFASLLSVGIIWYWKNEFSGREKYSWESSWAQWAIWWPSLRLLHPLFRESATASPFRRYESFRFFRFWETTPFRFLPASCPPWACQEPSLSGTRSHHYLSHFCRFADNGKRKGQLPSERFPQA